MMAQTITRIADALTRVALAYEGDTSERVAYNMEILEDLMGGYAYYAQASVEERALQGRRVICDRCDGFGVRQNATNITLGHGTAAGPWCFVCIGTGRTYTAPGAKPKRKRQPATKSMDRSKRGPSI